MKLSVVIVNYNVRHFLEQCLLSVQRACKDLPAEIWVVDNASADGSVEMVREKFSEVHLIANTENTGFSKANNQAIVQAKGEYILLLNPDTVVAEDTFTRCLEFMDSHPEAGALGVHMVDGKGVFLPESKRGLPTPAVAFYKTFGLAALFPKSTTFGRYHLGFLSEHETHEVDILSGAFMFMRKAALDKAGLLDETFFMYGEDVDLSYRLQKAGYKNYYFPHTTIIHYKGESTKKGSLNYVRVFYTAMIIFARKHYSSNHSGLFSLLINTAIVFRGALTLLSSLLASSYLFIIDALLSFAGIYFIKTYWENMIKYTDHYYPEQFLLMVVPLYILLWIFGTYLSGGYDKPYRVAPVVRGIVMGTVAIAVLYAFIPNEWRFSRAIILLGAAFTGAEMLFTRTLHQVIRSQSLTGSADEPNQSIIAGNTDETERAEKILRSLGSATEVSMVGDISNVPKALAIHKAGEVIFCAANQSYGHIIQVIRSCGSQYRYKILNPGSTALIGSNSKDGAGDLYVAEKSYPLFKPENLRRKRAIDILICLLMVVLLPFTLLLTGNTAGMVRNWWQVLTGKKWWVGLQGPQTLVLFKNARQGVVGPLTDLWQFNLTDEEKLTAELNYARRYSVANDVSLLWRNRHKAGA